MISMEKKKLKILQIEDNPGDVRLVCEMLKEIRQFDTDCETAETLEEGLSKIQCGSYDVVLLDLGLSESYGLETLNRVLAARHKIPAVIVMTIMDDEQIGIEAVKEGAQDYLIKGEINSHLLCRSIQYAIERHESKLKLQAANDQLEEKIQRRTVELRQTMESLKAEIKERKRTEIELKAAKEEAESASRAKSEFLAIINHELRTPLNGIIGFSRILLETPLNEEQEDYIETIISSSNSLFHIISEILDMVQLKTESFTLENERTDFYQFFHQIMEEANRDNPKKLSVLGHLSTACPQFLMIDRLRLKKVLMHLLSNAIKFTESGQVEFTVDLLSLSEETHQADLQFRIKDTGIGIRKCEEEKIFNAFRQADMSATRRHGGIGMGLSIAQSILEKSNSQLNFHSTYGEGSTFSFILTLSYCD